VFLPQDRNLAAHAYLLLIVALVVRLFALETLAPFAMGRRARPPRRRPPTRDLPSDVLRIATSLSTQTTWVTELYYRVRPALRELAAERLEASRGIRLDAEPDRARAALGPEAWALIRPDLGVPEDRFGRGLSLAELDEIVAAVEAI